MKVRLIVVFVLLSTALLVGQTFRGTILGSVTDPSGAFVSGASVKVKNTATGLERTTTTSADGSYSVPELPIGTYSVTVTLTGFPDLHHRQCRSQCRRRTPGGRGAQNRKSQ